MPEIIETDSVDEIARIILKNKAGRLVIHVQVRLLLIKIKVKR
jgi:hypothetical protein